MKPVLPAMAFVARHFLIVVCAVLAGSVLWTLAYLFMLVVAVIANQGLGGPLAFPAGLLFVLVTGVVLGWGIFAPASGIGAIFCGVFRLPRLAAIPVVFGGAFLLSYLVYWLYIELVTTHPMPSGWIVLKNYSISRAIANNFQSPYV